MYNEMVGTFERANQLVFQVLNKVRRRRICGAVAKGDGLAGAGVLLEAWGLGGLVGAGDGISVGFCVTVYGTVLCGRLGWAEL